MRGKELRLRRLFGKGKSVIVPMDHPIYFGPMPGIEDPKELVRDVAATPADGLLLTLGVLNKVVADIGSLGTIARIDGTQTRLSTGVPRVECISSVELAVASGADACVLNVYVGVETECELLTKLGVVAEDCERWGLPLVAEMIPAGALAAHYSPDAKKLSENELTEQIALAARVGAEIGADVIKSAYTGSPESFRYVVETATVPVIVAGGPGGDTDEGVLKLTEDCMKSGAAGVIFGRNVWKRSNRAEIIRKMCRIVHDGASAEEAMRTRD